MRHGAGLAVSPVSWLFTMQGVVGAGRGVTVRVEYVSRVPRPPLDGLLDDLYHLTGAPPYARLTLPPTPSALLTVSLGAPFRIRAGTDIETAEYADGCVVTMPTRELEFGYTLTRRTRSPDRDASCARAHLA